MTRPDPVAEITADQRLLLRAVLCRGDDAADAWSRWRARVVIEEIDPASFRLLPLLARRLGAFALDDPIRDVVRGVYRHAWVKNQLMIRDAATLIRAFKAAGVPSLVLKGAALAPYYGDNPGARPMYDVDILVPPDRVRDAAAVLDREGWRCRDGMTPEWLTCRLVPRRHSVAFSREMEGQLDLHWHVLGSSIGEDADRRFWAAATPFLLGGEKVHGLSTPDLLLHVLVHGAQPHHGGNAQWVADAVALLGHRSDSSFDERVANEARAHGVLLTLRRSLALIADIVGSESVSALLTLTERTRPLVLERVATSRLVRSGRATQPFGRIADGLLEQGGGDAGIVTRARELARAGLDLSLVRNPGFFAMYAALRRPSWLGRLGRRAVGTFVRTPLDTGVAYQLGSTLDFSDPAVSDGHAGPGWWRVTPTGISSHGPEARIVLPLSESVECDLELELGITSVDEQVHPVEVRVNEHVAARLPLAPVDAPSSHRIHVAGAVARRFSPLEVAFTSPRGRLRRNGSRARVHLSRMRVTRATASG